MSSTTLLGITTDPVPQILRLTSMYNASWFAPVVFNYFGTTYFGSNYIYDTPEIFGPDGTLWRLAHDPSIPLEDSVALLCALDMPVIEWEHLSPICTQLMKFHWKITMGPKGLIQTSPRTHIMALIAAMESVKVALTELEKPLLGFSIHQTSVTDNFWEWIDPITEQAITYDMAIGEKHAPVWHSASNR